MEVDRSLMKAEIQILLSPGLMRFASKGGNDRLELESYLRRYLDDLLTDLKMPEQLALEIDSINESPQWGPHPYQIFINGEHCRLPTRTVGMEDMSARDVAYSAACDIHTNRELMVSPRLSATVQNNWSA